MRRNRLQYHRTGANLRATPDFNIAEDLRPGANHYALSLIHILAALIADKGPQAALAQISGLDAASDVVAEAVNDYNAEK